MDKDTKTVENGGAADTTTEVKKESSDASTTTGIDLADALEQSLERERKLEEERDNYKKGLLKAKGKDTGDYSDLSEDERINAAVARALADSKFAEEKKVQEENTKQLIRRVKELEAASAAKSQMASSGIGGSNETVFKVGDNMLSEDQTQALRNKGWDDNKIARFKANLQKSR